MHEITVAVHNGAQVTVLRITGDRAVVACRDTGRVADVPLAELEGMETMILFGSGGSDE